MPDRGSCSGPGPNSPFCSVWPRQGRSSARWGRRAMIPNDFDQEARRQTIFAWAEIPIAIGSKPRGYPVGLARGDRVENGGGHDCAEDLGAEFFGTFWLT